MDAARTVADYLNGLSIGATCYYDVPSKRPDTFLVVEQTGGGYSDRVQTAPSVDVDCWAQTRREAAVLADSVCSALLSMPDTVQNVFNVSISTVYHDPDMETGTPRYVIGVDIVANE